MAKAIGKVEAQNGKFFAKDADGNIRELHVGDEVFEGEIIYGDGERIVLGIDEGARTLVLDSQTQLLLDQTLIDHLPDNDTVQVDRQTLNEALDAIQTENEAKGQFADRNADVTDVNSDLRADSSKDGKEDGTPKGKFADRDGDETDVNSDLRVSDTGDGILESDFHGLTSDDAVGSSGFAPRTGSKTDINSSLRSTENDDENRREDSGDDRPQSPSALPPEPEPVTPPPVINILSLNINTLQVAQVSGNEDAGRSAGNTSKVSVTASNIDQAAQGLSLEATTVTPQAGFPASGYGIILSAIPDGASILYNGTLFTKDTASGSGLTIIDSGNDSNGNSGWNVEIANFDNSADFRFIPPHNSDKEYILDVKAFVLDGNDMYITQPLQIAVDVMGVADIPIHDDLATTTVIDDSSIAHTFNLTHTEDTTLSLKNILATPLTLDSYDTDGSETLTMRVTGLESGFNITGTGVTFLSGSGTGRKWLVEVDELLADHVTLTKPTHYAGEVDFKIQFITTENEGDSKTHSEKDVTVMITPEVDNSIHTTDTQNEDEVLTLDFGLNNLDSGATNVGKETVQTFEIDVTGLQAAGVTLNTAGGVDLTTGKTGFQSIVVTAGSLESVTATLTEDSHMNGGYDFDIRYTITDVAQDTALNTYTDTKTVTENYTVAVTAITDDITLSSTTTTTTNNTVDGSGDVTATDNGIFTKVLTVVGLDTDGRGNLETDGSEQFTRVTVSGVPAGITIADGVYAGDTGGGNYSGFWYVDIPNQAIDGSTSYDLVFNMDGSFVDGANFPITITAFNEDFGTGTDNLNGVEQSDSITFNLIISGTITGPGPGTPVTITDFYQDIDNDSTHDHTYTVATATDTTITDTDAYQGSVLREDTQFNLSDVIHVGTDNTGATAQTFSITLANVPAGVVIDGMTYNSSGGFYTISGAGNQAAIVAALNAIQVTPISNTSTDGTNATSIANTDLAFDIELTTYASGGAKNTALINFSGSVLPVTDAMDLTVVNDGTAAEDTQQAFSITLDNSADGAKTTIVDGKVYIQLTENYTDSNDGTDGTLGVLKENGTIITTTTVTGVAGITDGDYYVLTGKTYNDTLNFTYDPAEDRNGTITVNTFVKNIESESWTTYDTTEQVSTKTFTFNVTAAQDGFTFDGVKEVFTATFDATFDADTVTFDGVGALTLTAGQTAIQNATEYTTAYNLIAGATWIAVDNGDGTVTFTAKTAGDRTDIANGDFVIAGAGSGTDTTVTVSNPTTQGVAISGSGIEDNLAQLHMTISNPDSSEVLNSLLLDKIPDGFLVYSGATEGSAILATNTGANGTTTVEMTYGNPTSEISNLWKISLINGELPAYIGIKPPANWSGTISNVEFQAVDSDGNTSNSGAINVAVTPVVDTLTINATQTFGYQGADVALKINANVEDLDSSETVTLTITGLGNDATFKVDGTTIGNSYDGVNDIYTITSIDANNINDVTFNKASSDMNASVSVTAQMVESDGAVSALATGTSSFNVEIVSTSATPTTGDDTLLANGTAQDGLAGIDTVIFTSTSDIIYANLTNIEAIDLNAGNQTLDGSGVATGLTLAEVVNLTDTNNDIKILGDSGDTVKFDTENGNTWSKGSTVTEDGHTFDVYTNSGDSSVTVKIEDNISDSII